mmetsp:Transcript_4451/g.9327  ORF Transcript_4451/g.9327 Transcript_4451/m.9327 type:complete len:205 (-) Transcript_4451:129-743(-)
MVQDSRGEGSSNLQSRTSMLIIFMVGVIRHVGIGQDVDPNIRLLLKHAITLEFLFVGKVCVVVRRFAGLFGLAVIPVIPAVQNGFDSKKDGQEQFGNEHRPRRIAALLDNRFDRDHGLFRRKGPHKLMLHLSFGCLHNLFFVVAWVWRGNHQNRVQAGKGSFQRNFHHPHKGRQQTIEQVFGRGGFAGNNLVSIPRIQECQIDS